MFRFVLATILAAWTLWSGGVKAYTTGKLAPEISGRPWINSKPLTLNDLRGRVVLVEFWTYG